MNVNLYKVRQIALELDPEWICDGCDAWVMYQNHSLEDPRKTWEEFRAERVDC